VTILETLPQAGEHIAEVAAMTNNEEVGERVHAEGPVEAVTDKGYHSNDTLTALQQAQVRSYVSEPDRRVGVGVDFAFWQGLARVRRRAAKGSDVRKG
jgi:hypothetical protein